MEVKDIIYSRRIELRLTQTAVAKYCGVSVSTYSRWESGDINDIKRDKIAKLAEILKLDPVVLVFGEENSTDQLLSLINASNLDEKEADEIFNYIKYVVSKR